ncbi:Hypothetical_protein [Hexamita inflata]|uniref:Hypothetical_protein n=1 Tax=Hexamita inflata TaxID=28002 RepID=A0AA86QNG9_9EUKA|nr:Hypothetical protein HINF_LOCUS46466 [Hexamita inflata]
MTLIMSTQGKDTDQLLTFSKQDQQLLCEYEIDEIEANIKLTFSAPQYTINNNRYSILNDHGDWIDVLLPAQRKIDDETQLLQVIQNLSDTNYKYEVDNDYFLNNNKLKFKATGFKALKSDDHYFCKAFGLVKGTIYERDTQGFITATNILYPYIYKYICINCYDIQDYTLIDQGQKRYLLLKQFRTWNAGTITQVTSDIIVTFQINQLIKGFRVQFQDEMYQDLQLNGDEYTLELYINKSKKVLMRIQQQEEARILREQEFEYKKQIEQQRQAAIQQQYIEQEQQAQQEAQNIYFQQESDLQKQEDIWRSKQRIPNDNEFTRYINQNYDLLQSKKSQKVKLSKMFKKKQLKAQQFLLGVQQLDEEIEELEESRLQLLISQNKNDVKMSVQDLGDTAEGHFPKVVKRDPDEQIALSDRLTIQGPLSINELNDSVHPPVVKVDPNEVIPQQELQPQQQSQHPQIVKIDPTDQIINTDQSDIQVVDSGTTQRQQTQQREQEIINQPEQPSSWNLTTNQNNIPIIKNENQIQDTLLEDEFSYLDNEFQKLESQNQQMETQLIELQRHFDKQEQIKREKTEQKYLSIIEQLRQIQTKDDMYNFIERNPDYEEFINNFEKREVAYFINERQQAEQRIKNNLKYLRQVQHEVIQDDQHSQIDQQQENEMSLDQAQDQHSQIEQQLANEVPLDQVQVQQIYGEPKETPIQYKQAPTPPNENIKQTVLDSNTQDVLQLAVQHQDNQKQYKKICTAQFNKIAEQTDVYNSLSDQQLLTLYNEYQKSKNLFTDTIPKDNRVQIQRDINKIKTYLIEIGLIKDDRKK